MRTASPSPPLLAVLLAGCTPAGTFTIPAEGIELELPGGAGLAIPAGAVNEDVEITATLITDLAGSGYSAAPGYTSRVPFALALEPHGLQFNQPATLTLPDLDGGAWPVVLRSDDEADTTWESAGVVESGDGAVSLSIGGFSGYALSYVADVACPCFDASDTPARCRAGGRLR
jgi:hypothetical protein